MVNLIVLMLVKAPGRDYDVINPPLLHISDNAGVGATGYVSVNGGFYKILELLTQVLIMKKHLQ